MRTDTSVRSSEHHVELFDSSKSLADTVAAYLLAGLNRGEALLVVATPQHRELLGRRLEEGGLNVRDAIMANRLVMLDAAQTLNKLMRCDLPSATAFDEVVGTLVERLSNDQRVCIYGEMVDVLASQGNFAGAQQLEELWNVLGKREAFTLFCGYASAHFGDPESAKVLAPLCAAHTHLHRKASDRLAEFLLEQQGIVTVPSGSTPS